MDNWRPLEEDHQKIITLYEESDEEQVSKKRSLQSLHRDIVSKLYGSSPDKCSYYLKAQSSDARGYFEPSGDKLKPPAVYIFNHENFPTETRKGSSKDVDALRKTFEKMKCTIEVVPNPTFSMVKDTVTKLTRKCFYHLSALVIVILSHGNRKEKILACDDKEYDLDDDILFPLYENETLADKPKILIVQACKGNCKADCNTKRNPSSYIKCYSTTEGFESYRNETNGSIFIQTLCNVMDQDGLTKDFLSIIEDVNVKVEVQSDLIG
ncbi:hypothetical protein M5D96_008461 [Drosophila gunungcola]|uniref:Caspase-3 n=2 Tax=Drosophila gunungcola TaxID=103775 RepID=A0A9Q0BP19_9MUSC|nr:hypothetical protein M5D96_008461 [Drosophila gunungcola]